jgi:hypothetical protein
MLSQVVYHDVEGTRPDRLADEAGSEGAGEELGEDGNHVDVHRRRLSSPRVDDGVT